MLQSDPFTGAQNINAPEGRSNSREHAARENLVPTPDQVVRMALEPVTDDLTTGVPDRDTNVAILRAFSGNEGNEAVRSRNFSFPQPQPPRTSTFHALQEWEGYVLEIGAEQFMARLIDLTAGAEHEEEEADIPLDEISDEDSAKMRPGSIFRWVIGYERSVAGTKRRVSQIVFRDLPAITKTDLRDGEKWARETIRSLEL